MSDWFYLPIVLAAGYYLTTLILWFSHWFAHLPWSPMRVFHVLGHHANYPTGQNCLSKRFIYGSGWHDSIYIFIPWLAIEALAIWFLLPVGFALMLTIEATLIALGFSYLHEQFHLVNSRHQCSSGFTQARKLHFLHHDKKVNFAVFDHFWDRVFNTAL